jgi:hypothetical protein
MLTPEEKPTPFTALPKDVMQMIGSLSSQLDSMEAERDAALRAAREMRESPTEGMSERERLIRKDQPLGGFLNPDAVLYLLGVIDVLREDRNRLRECLHNEVVDHEKHHEQETVPVGAPASSFSDRERMDWLLAETFRHVPPEVIKDSGYKVAMHRSDVDTSMLAAGLTPQPMRKVTMTELLSIWHCANPSGTDTVDGMNAVAEALGVADRIEP